MTRILACCCVMALFATSNAGAQQTLTLEPVVTASIDPARVVVGQRATLVVTVLAPNYMPAPPVLPDFQVRNAVTRPLGSINQTETRDGAAYAMPSRVSVWLIAPSGRVTALRTRKSGRTGGAGM